MNFGYAMKKLLQMMGFQIMVIFYSFKPICLLVFMVGQKLRLISSS